MARGLAEARATVAAAPLSRRGIGPPRHPALSLVAGALGPPRRLLLHTSTPPPRKAHASWPQGLGPGAPLPLATPPRGVALRRPDPATSPPERTALIPAPRRRASFSPRQGCRPAGIRVAAGEVTAVIGRCAYLRCTGRATAPQTNRNDSE